MTLVEARKGGARGGKRGKGGDGGGGHEPADADTVTTASSEKKAVGRWANFGSGPPRRLDFVDDKARKSHVADKTVIVRGDEKAGSNAFEWEQG